ILYAESGRLPDALPTPLAPPPAPPSTASATPSTAASVPEASATPSDKSRMRASVAPKAAPRSALSPAQLLLLDPAPTAPTEPPPPAATPDRQMPPPEPDPPHPTPPIFQAPLRLPVTVRDALQDILATLAGRAEDWAAHPLDGGLFVPLTAF